MIEAEIEEDILKVIWAVQYVMPLAIQGWSREQWKERPSGVFIADDEMSSAGNAEAMSSSTLSQTWGRLATERGTCDD